LGWCWARRFGGDVFLLRNSSSARIVAGRRSFLRNHVGRDRVFDFGSLAWLRLCLATRALDLNANQRAANGKYGSGFRT
jgi:hypothetical protein